MSDTRLEDQLLIHVGQPQAASTTLQKSVFNDKSNGFDLLTPFEQRGSTVGKFIQDPEPGNYDPVECREFFRERVQEPENNDLCPVISNEGLSGTGMFVGSRNYEQELFADRLKKAFPGASIFLVVREQVSAIISKYRKLIETGGNVSLDRFIRTDLSGVSAGGWAVDMDYLYVDLLKYDRIIRYYHDLFGEQKVCVLPVEMLSSEPDEFLQRLSAFADVQIDMNGDEIPRKNQWGNKNLTSILRYLNMVFSPRSPSLLWFLTLTQEPEEIGSFEPYKYVRKGTSRVLNSIPGFSSTVEREKRRQKDALRESIGDYFAESNAETAELTGLDLSRFGYQLP